MMTMRFPKTLQARLVVCAERARMSNREWVIRQIELACTASEVSAYNAAADSTRENLETAFADFLDVPVRVVRGKTNTATRQHPLVTICTLCRTTFQEDQIKLCARIGCPLTSVANRIETYERQAADRFMANRCSKCGVPCDQATDGCLIPGCPAT